MAKRTKKPMSPGIHWRPTEEGWVPRFVWKRLEAEGMARPAKALMPNEAFIVVMEFANAAGKAIFGVAPYKSVEVEGRLSFEADPAFDELPTIKDLLGGLKAPEDNQIKGAQKAPKETLIQGIPRSQIDPDTLP